MILFYSKWKSRPAKIHLFETSDRYRRHTIPGSVAVAMELRRSPTDENYFSGSTFVPDLLLTLVGKLISEKGRPLRQIDLEKNSGVVPD